MQGVLGTQPCFPRAEVIMGDQWYQVKRRDSWVEARHVTLILRVKNRSHASLHLKNPCSEFWHRELNDTSSAD